MSLIAALLCSGSVSRGPSHCGSCVILLRANRAFHQFPQTQICSELLNVNVWFPSVCAINSVSGDMALITPRGDARALSSACFWKHAIHRTVTSVWSAAACDAIVLLAAFRCIISAPLALFRRRVCPLQIVCVASQDGRYLSPGCCCFPVSSSAALIDRWSSIQRRVQRYAALVDQWQWLPCSLPLLLFISRALLLLDAPSEPVFADTSEHLWGLCCLHQSLISYDWDSIQGWLNQISSGCSWLGSSYLEYTRKHLILYEVSSHVSFCPVFDLFIYLFLQFSKPWSQNKYVATSKLCVFSKPHLASLTSGTKLGPCSGGSFDSGKCSFLLIKVNLMHNLKWFLFCLCLTHAVPLVCWEEVKEWRVHLDHVKVGSRYKSTLAFGGSSLFWPLNLLRSL